MGERTKEQISFNMSRIKSRDTGIERALRSCLRKHKIRFRSNVKRVFGRPDFIIPDMRVAIFCDSAFWHGYKNGKTRRHLFKSNQLFWQQKLQKNIARDKLVNRTLKAAGWKVLRFWDFKIKKDSEQCIKAIKCALGNELEN